MFISALVTFTRSNDSVHSLMLMFFPWTAAGARFHNVIMSCKMHYSGILGAISSNCEQYRLCKYCFTDNKYESLLITITDLR